MASSRSRRHEPCAHEDCGSRRFHIGNDGFTYCDQGHQQSERGAVIAEDTGELVTLGRKQRRKDSDAGSAISKGSSFSGTEAFEQYLLCLQLVLRYQLRWLIDLRVFPAELEIIVKDLWALRLRKYHLRVSKNVTSDNEALNSQAFSSQSESETTVTSKRSQRSRSDDGRVQEGSPNSTVLLALLYIGTLLLRIPVTVADIHGWTNAGLLPYYQASRKVPLGMRERLPGKYQVLLDPQDLLQPEALHHTILDVLMAFHQDFGMAVPSLNVPLVLFRWVQLLRLPLEAYAATRRLARILSIEIAFNLSPKSGTSIALRYPEIQLAALMVIATKLLYPFDDLERYSRSETDLCGGKLDWQEWSRAMSEDSQGPGKQSELDFAQAFDLNERDCVEAADERLDAYLSWYEDTIATEDIRVRGSAGADAEFRRALFRMFPISGQKRTGNGKATSKGNDERGGESRGPIMNVMSGQVIESEGADDRINRYGSFYRRFRSPDELDCSARLFFVKAAQVAGSSLETLVQAVFLTERKMQKLEEDLRKGRSAN